MNRNSSLITILTPAYNRADTLPRLYNSLLLQKKKNFIWYIVDDGSTDSTYKYVNSLIKICNEFIIIYKLKPNGGKHTALNLGINDVNTDLVFVVDSDDLLRIDATELIEYYWLKYNKTISNLSAFWFLQENSNGKVLGDCFRKNEFLSFYTKEFINNSLKGDKKAVYVTKIRNKFLYPVFEGERFFGEGFIHKIISNLYPAIFINKSIYISEYLKDGLTSQGRKMRFMNPLGGSVSCLPFLEGDVKFFFRIKKMVLYIIYMKLQSYSFKYIYMSTKYKVLYIFSLIPALIIKMFINFDRDSV